MIKRSSRSDSKSRSRSHSSNRSTSRSSSSSSEESTSRSNTPNNTKLKKENQSIRKSRSRSGTRKKLDEYEDKKDSVKSSRIFIGRLTRNVLKDHIKEIFSTYGEIKHTEMPYDNVHHMFNKGFAYVEFMKVEDADNACKYMDGGQIDGQEVKVSITQPPKPRYEMGRDRDYNQNDTSREYSKRTRSPARRNISSERKSRTTERANSSGGKRSRSPINKSKSSYSKNGIESNKTQRNRSSSSSSSRSSN